MLLPLEQVVPFGVLEHLRAKARDCTMLTRRPEQLGSRRRPRSVSLCLSEWASFLYHSNCCSAGTGGTTLHQNPPPQPMVEQSPRLELGDVRQTFFIQDVMPQDFPTQSLSMASTRQFKLRALLFNMRISWM